MTSEESKEFVLEAWKVFGTRKRQNILELFTDDAEWVAPRDNATAVALKSTGQMVGKEVIAEFLASGMYGLFKDVRIEFSNILASGSTVALEYHMSASISGGRKYENDYCLFFLLENFRIRQIREYMDTLKGYKLIFNLNAVE